MAIIRCDRVGFNSVQALVFDKDGTLADSEAYLLQVGLFRLKFLEAKVAGVSPALFQILGFSPESVDPAGALAVASQAANEQLVVAYLEQIGYCSKEALQITRSAFKQATEALAAQPSGHKARCTPLLPGCLELLQKAVFCSVKVAVLSSDTTANVQDFLQYYSLSSLVDLGVGTDQGLTKPNPALLHQTCQILQVSPQHTVVIGDAETDFRMAQLAGSAGSIGVTWGWQQRPSFQLADVTIHHPATLQMFP